MKKLWLLFALPLAVLVAQTPAETPSAYIDVKLAAGGGNKTSHSYRGNPDLVADTTKQTTRRMAVSITAGTLMHSPLDAKIEWYFIAKSLVTKRDFIFDHGTKDLTIGAGGVEKFDAVSKDLKSTVTNETLFGMSEIAPKSSGGKPEGWIVRVLTGSGAVLAVKGSSPALEDIGNDPDQLQKFLAAK